MGAASGFAASRTGSAARTAKRDGRERTLIISILLVPAYRPVFCGTCTEESLVMEEGRFSRPETQVPARGNSRFSATIRRFQAPGGVASRGKAIDASTDTPRTAAMTSSEAPIGM